MPEAAHTGGHSRPVALVTGGGVRIGAATVRLLHSRGYHILLHFNTSQESALALAMDLNTDRSDSVHCLQADLRDPGQLEKLAKDSEKHWGRLDVLVNNASSFYPTPLDRATENDWQELMGTNARAPFFLTQKLAGALRQSRGCIVNIVDIHARGTLKGYSIYSMAKAALETMTRALARDLAPDVRVNGVAPGAILWPEKEAAALKEQEKQAIIGATCLGRMGTPEDIAEAVRFLIEDAHYMTGQVIAVDGGRFT